MIILRELAGSGPGRKVRAVAGRVLPGLRYVTEEARACELEATLGLLLGAGLRPRESFEVLLQVAEEDPLLRRSLSRGAALLPSGASFAECVAPSLPADDRPRFLTAEKAGRLDETLARLAESHRERHLHRLKSAALAVQIASVVALAPLCFGLVMGLVWPALATVKTVAEQATTLKGPVDEFATKVDIQVAPKATRMDVRTSEFNETQASKVTAYMQEHGAKEEKKVPKIKIKDRSVQRLQRSRLRATEIRSNLD
ncbi:MAG: type II secretion system F family protein [Elusimicrobiota bacterium]|nr:MAG: type II secretion system F family protein [Elusimicrobiota bacterium]